MRSYGIVLPFIFILLLVFLSTSSNPRLPTGGMMELSQSDIASYRLEMISKRVGPAQFYLFEDIAIEEKMWTDLSQFIVANYSPVAGSVYIIQDVGTSDSEDWAMISLRIEDEHPDLDTESLDWQEFRDLIARKVGNKWILREFGSPESIDLVCSSPQDLLPEQIKQEVTASFGGCQNRAIK